MKLHQAHYGLHSQYEAIEVYMTYKNREVTRYDNSLILNFLLLNTYNWTMSIDSISEDM